MIVMMSKVRRILDNCSAQRRSRKRLGVKKPCIGVSVAIAISSVCGCSTVVQRNDWNAYTGPGAEYFRKQEYKLPYVPDPLEPSNRIVWDANDFLLFDVIEPVTAAWRFLVPQSVRAHLVNAVRNIRYPVRAVNQLLQGNYAKARDESYRFVINSTVGILGLFDPAAEWGIEPAPEDLGLTFVKWGWTDSPYVVLPLAGPSTVRDALGQLGDLFLDPTSYFFTTGLAARFVDEGEILGSAKRMVRTNYDAYGVVRNGWTISRWPRSTHIEKEVEGDGPASQTLGASLFKCRDPWFFSRARTSLVTLPSTGKQLPYDVWMQPDVAPMVYIVPGMGAHRRADDVVAVAEMAYDRGFSVATISSTFNFDFMEKAATVPVPGFAPADANDVHVALSAISDDLKNRFPNRISAQVFMGVSLGAFHGLYIAAKEHSLDDSLVDFDRYVLLSPPVALRYAAQQLDAYYNVPLTFPEAHRDEHVRAIMQKITEGVMNDSSDHDKYTLISEKDAQFLIGLSFRVVLHDAIWCSQQRNDKGILKSRLDPMQRAPVSDEILDFSFMEYMHAFVLPCCTNQDARIDSGEKMFKLVDARSLSDDLPTDGTVRVFSSANDFLLSDADRQWLIQTLGESNVTFETGGGHTGSLHRPEVQRKIMDSLEDLLPVHH